MQSAYRPHHSTESALQLVYNDIVCALDDRKEALLVLLDFSSAFDTIDLEILLNRFAHRYGISGSALKWITSYFCDRAQAVCVKHAVADKSNKKWGVPQGSVARPLFFIVYTAPLFIIHSYGISTVVYTDDTQLYLTFKPEHQDKALSLWNHGPFITSWSWMISELSTSTSKFIKNSAPSPSIVIGQAVIKASKSIWKPLTQNGL